MVILDIDMPKSCFGCSTKVNPEERRCNIDGHIFEETFSVCTSRRDKDCPIKCDIEDIKAEIEHEADYQDAYVDADVAKGLYMAVEIIDKYTKGAEE